MKQGDYSGYVGKHVVCAVAEFSSNGKSGVVTHADSYGWLTVDWDIPDERHGKQGLLAVNEIRVIEKKEIQIEKELYSIKPLEWKKDSNDYALIPNGFIEIVPKGDEWIWRIIADGEGDFVDESININTFDEAKKLAEKMWIDEIKKYLIREK